MLGSTVPSLTTPLRRCTASLCGYCRWGLILAIGISGSIQLSGQTIPRSQQLANELIESDPQEFAALAATSQGSAEAADWVAGLDATWYNTANGIYFAFLKQIGDQNLAQPQGESNASSGPAARSFGRLYLLLYRVTLKQAYFEAARKIHDAATYACKPTSDSAPEQSRTCTAEPFLAEYAAVFQSPSDFDWIAKDLRRRSDHEQSEVSTAEAERAVSLVQTLPYIPESEAANNELISSLEQIASSFAAHQDPKTGLFTDSKRGTQHGAPLPPDATCRVIYALFRAARLGYLPRKYAANAQRAWNGLLRTAVVTDSTGKMQWAHGEAGRPGGFTARSIGTGAFLLAANEADLAPEAGLARNKTVLLDAWFNSQQRKNAAGQQESFHYKWSDRSDSGYALFGHMLRSVGMKTETLDEAPTLKNLAGAQYYLIVSPDIPIKNPNPHYVNNSDAKQVAAWVRQGGILVLLENDPPNADIDHLNLLADRVGLHFENVLHHHILGEQVEDGRIPVDGSGPLFQHPHTLYMKDTTAITLRGPGTVLLRDRGDVVMAAVKYGRGTVFAAVDPWLYNEYTDGRKNPKIYSQFDNFAGGQEFVRWLSQLRPSNSKTGKR